MNRRYPESTVIETYRLSWWTNFLEVTEQLPDRSTTSQVCVPLSNQEEKDDRTTLFEGCTTDAELYQLHWKPIQLTSEQVKDIHSLYICESTSILKQVPTYDASHLMC